MIRFLSFLNVLLVVGGFDAWINEFHYRNYQQDVDLFIEVIGPANQEAWRYQLLMYQGRDGTQFHEGISLSGRFFSEGITKDFGFIKISLPNHGAIRKGKMNGDALALVKDSECIQFISYGDLNSETFSGTTGACFGIQSTNIGVNEPFNMSAGYSLQLHGTGRFHQNFTWWETPVPATPSEVNLGQTLLTAEEHRLVSDARYG